MLISVLVLAVVIVLAILISIGVKVEHNKGGEEVIKTVYLYLVLFATLMMSIGGSVGVFMAAADIISPNAYFQSFEEYRLYPEKHNAEFNAAGQGNTKLSNEEMLARYTAMVSAEKERQIQRGKNSLIKSLGWIIIPFPVFLYFQRRLAKKDF